MIYLWVLNTTICNTEGLSAGHGGLSGPTVSRSAGLLGLNLVVFGFFSRRNKRITVTFSVTESISLRLLLSSLFQKSTIQNVTYTEKIIVWGEGRISETKWNKSNCLLIEN